MCFTYRSYPGLQWSVLPSGLQDLLPVIHSCSHLGHILDTSWTHPQWVEWTLSHGSVWKVTEPRKKHMKSTNSFADSDQTKQTVDVKIPLISMLLLWVVFTGNKYLSDPVESPAGSLALQKRLWDWTQFEDTNRNKLFLLPSRTALAARSSYRLYRYRILYHNWALWIWQIVCNVITLLAAVADCRISDVLQALQPRQQVFVLKTVVKVSLAASESITPHSVCPSLSCSFSLHS